MRKTILAVPALALVMLTDPSPVLAASFPAVRGSGGAVVSPEATSTTVGLDILRAGGNAVDAAVATALAMAVVHPEAGNLGGGGFAVVRVEGQLATLDFRETAPAAAHRDMYLDEKGEPRPGASWVGPLAAGVPGSPAGLQELHSRFGELPWSDVVKPAIVLARDGFLVTRRLNEAVEGTRERLARFPETAAIWLPGGEPPAVGSRVFLPDLAATLEAYADQGREAIQSGHIARAIATASRRYGGILTIEDLASYQPVWREPLRFDAFGWSFASMGLPSSGGFLVGGSLQLLERLGYAHEMPRGARRAHMLAEVWRRVFADRVLLGDPGSTQAEPTALLAGDRLARLAGSIEAEQAMPSERVAGGDHAELFELLERLGPIREPSETNHLAVADIDGNLVALTTTLNGSFGCGLLVPGAGFLLNNEMDDFATVPGRPNAYGLIQGPANEIRPGRRMLSSMSPTLAWKGDESITIGGRGGSKIPTAVAQALLGLLTGEHGLQESIDTPRIHHQWFPDRIGYEDDALAPETREALSGFGHLLAESSGLARVHAVRRLAGGDFEAAGDPRGPAVGGIVDPEP
ncbi:MAG: gamma-glutamyltransferase [Acidobacteriota bacterium]|nr:gamma-glutamyltransferase [Acidobacteriota bacterium]